MHNPRLPAVPSCSALCGKSLLKKCPSGTRAFSSPSTPPCFYRCQECSLLPSAAEAQCWHAGKQLLTLVSLLLFTGLAVAMGRFVASGICKENDEMVLH